MKVSLKVKMVGVVLFFTILLSGTIVSISYNIYKNAFMDQYESIATSIAKSTASIVDREQLQVLINELQLAYDKIYEKFDGIPDHESNIDWAAYYEEFAYISEMQEYQNLLNVLMQLKEDHDVLSLYLGYSDISLMKDLYLVDASDEPCVPGDFDEISEETLEQMKNGTYEYGVFITNYPEYGWLCSAAAPIVAADGSIIGTALVDISMNGIMAEIQNFLYLLLGLTGAMTVAIIFVILRFMNKAVLRPIEQLSDAAGAFVSNKKENMDSENSEISKLEIKTNDEIEMLSDSIKKMEKDLNIYITELTEVTAEKERIGAELDVAKDIQASMLPWEFPEREEFEICAYMTPAKQVGGDFYDFFMVDETHLAIVIADVSGKGVPAALFMVIAKTLIKDHTTPECDLGAIFTKVNNLLCESNSEEMFVTAFEGVLDLVTGEFRFVNAGHETPYICKHDGNFEPYPIRAGFVLAGMEGIRYRGGSMMLEEGDMIFQYTDGVTEATSISKELYGDERLHHILQANKDKNTSEILTAVKGDIDKFQGEADQFDDITMLCLKFKKKIMKKELILPALVENIPMVTDFVENILDAYGCSMHLKLQMDVAVDEIFANIAMYAYAPGTGEAVVKAEILEDPRAIEVIFMDKGIPYNPLEKPDPDITLSAEERKIGGLGIFMVKKSMDEMTYEYKDGQNILRLVKKF